MPTKDPRQPTASLAAANGVVASRLPTPPTEKINAASMPNRSCGNQRANTTIDPIRPAAQPTPIKPRAKARLPSLSLIAKSIDPATAEFNDSTSRLC